MSIRARVEDAIVLYHIGRPEASLLSALVAVAATSRRRYRSTKMGDRQAFEAFLRDEMPRLCGVKECNLRFRGSSHPIEHIFYKWFRCELTHSAALPIDVVFAVQPGSGSGLLGVDIGGDGRLALSQSWLDALLQAVIHAPENSDHFGIPPRLPVPIELPKVNLRIGC
jgi:hypothetical protein